MTVVERQAGPPSRWRRAWGAPVRVHVAGLALLSLALLPVIGTSGAFMPDEGAAVIQARSLAGGDGWVVEHPVPEMDPDGRHYPLALGEEGAGGVAPLGKHPLYPLLLAGALRLGGVPAMFLLSVLGTLAAAAFAAALAGRLDHALARPAVWVVGGASPLLFDGYLLVAHTLGAAAAAGAVLAAVVAVEDRSRRALLGVVAGVAVAVLLRNEAVLLAGALAAVAAAVAAARRDAVLAAVAAVTAAAAATAHLGERLWIGAIVGGHVGAPAAPFRHGADGFLSGRLRGLALTWLAPTQTGSGIVVVALLVMVAAVAVAAARVRRRPEDGRRIVAPAGVAAAASVVALAVAPTNVVPGLLVAFPLVLAGLVVLDRRSFVTLPPVLLGATTGLFTLAVLATQYSTGGTGEWGGRYFAIGIPVAVPVVLLAIRRAGRSLSPETSTRAAAALAVCSLAMTTMALAAHRAEVRSSTALATSVVQASGEVGEPRPVVVTTDVILPRLAWPAFDHVRWVLATPGQVGGVVARLEDAGIDRFAVVTATPDREGARLGGARVVSSRMLHGTALAMLIVEGGG